MGRTPLALLCITLVFFFVNVNALDAPTVSSPNYPDQSKWYMPTLSIELSWNEVESATKYYYSMDKEPNTEPSLESNSTLETTAAYKKTGGVWYFHVRAAKGNNLGPTTHFKVQLDSARPDWEELSPLKATATADGNIILTWHEATDSDSGVSHYELYRSATFDFDLRGASKKYSPIEGTSYTDTNDMAENMTFFYLLVAIDKAGNQSRVSNKASATTYAFCDIDFSFDVALSDDKQKLLISIDADGNLYGGTLVATLPDDKTVEFFREAVPFTDYNAEFDLNETVEGIILVDLTARERLGDDCSQSKEFIYDVTSPSIEIISPELNETIAEEIVVKVEAFDNGDYKSGIDSVEFFVRREDWELLGEMAADGNNIYSIDWNTFNFDNGRHQLKAIVKDAVGNSAEHVSGAIIFNTLYQQGDANAAINAALDSKQNALDFIDSLQKQNVLSESIKSLLTSADSNLSKARELYTIGGNEYTSSRSFAKRAQELFDAIHERLTIEKSDEQSFIYNKEQVGILLNASPLERSLIQEAELLIATASPQRKLELIKVSDENSSYYRANVVVTFSVPVDYLTEKDLNFLRVIEFVPKEFAAEAADIYSYYEFTVIEGDPIIEFKIDKELIATGEISYGLNKDLTEEEANALIEDGIINKYVVPPVLLHDATASLLGFSIPSLPSISIAGLDLKPELLAGIGAILIVVAALLLLGLLYRKRKKRSAKFDLSIFE